jgi:hypothetical protein
LVALELRELRVDESVHRVHDDGTDTAFGWMAQQVVKDGPDVGERLA